MDDYEDTARVFAELAKALGHCASVATTASAALAIAQSERLDIAFLDISLGIDDGIDVGRRIRAARVGEQLKLIAMSGYADAMSRCEPGVFDGFLLKPVPIVQFERWLTLAGDARQS
ncbi:response regulator [Pararobbsia alpina]|uniref:response regulator n=1 Tax=Pararobbsia alpina TaxID=621374 RepID=UPI0039A5BFE3